MLELVPGIKEEGAATAGLFQKQSVAVGPTKTEQRRAEGFIHNANYTLKNERQAKKPSKRIGDKERRMHTALGEAKIDPVTLHPGAPSS